MKIKPISRLLILSVTMAFTTLAKSNDNTFSEHLRNCDFKKGKTQCWKMAENDLQALPAPSNSKEFFNKFESYYLLAKTAYYVGDFSDADRLFKIVESLNSTHPKYERHEDMDLTPMIQYDHGILFLSMHSYESALNMFENAEHSASNVGGYSDFKFETSIGKAAALLGLSQRSALENVLIELTNSLKFKELAPWERWPFGPQLIGPYSTGRRIVAAYARMRQYERALMLLDKLEKERSQVMDALTDLDHQSIQSRPWATLCNPSDLKADRSEILILQGNFKQAEAILNPLLKIDLSDHPNIRKRVLTKLAKIEEKKGHKALQMKFLVEAAKIFIKERENQFDPLAETFGYIP